MADRIVPEPAAAFAEIAPAAMAYAEELQRLRDLYAETRDPALRRTLYEQVRSSRT